MKREEYELRAAEFRALLIEESKKPYEDQEWPEADQWLTIPGHQTCTTPSCVAFDVRYDLVLHENADGVFRGVCGACGHEMTPVPTFEDEEE